MTDNAKHLERLSALADGELSQLEVRQVLRDVEGCEQSAKQWRTTHLLRSVASKEKLDFAHIDISAKVAQAVREQPTVKKGFTVPAMPQQFGKFAIAASVAMAAVFGVQFWQSPNLDNPTFADNQDSVSELNRAFQVPQVITRNVSTGQPALQAVQPMSRPQLSQADLQRLQQALDGQTAPSAEARSHLERLMAEHAEVSASIQGQSLLQRARYPVSEQPQKNESTDTESK